MTVILCNFVRDINRYPSTFQLIARDMEKKNKHTMTLRTDSLKNAYLPVAWEYREVIEEEIKKNSTGKIFYFCQDEGICEVRGRIIELKEENEGLFIVLDTESKVRIDRIITLYGKPGAAYDEYDAYANACMDCMGGYEKEEL